MTLHPSLRPHSYQIRRKYFFDVCLSLCVLVTSLLVVRRIFELDFENHDFALVKRDKCEKYYTTSNVEKSTVDVKYLLDVSVLLCWPPNGPLELQRIHAMMYSRW